MFQTISPFSQPPPPGVVHTTRQSFLSADGAGSHSGGLILYRISRIVETKTIGLLFLISLLLLPTSVFSKEVQKGDSVIIITQGVRARLCPYPDCGQDVHTSRIPEGTVLIVRNIINIEPKRVLGFKGWTVSWYQVNYMGTTGWISMFDTEIAPNHFQPNVEGQVAYLYVETLPENSRIKILNIHPKFYQGIELMPNTYHIEVSAVGYVTEKKWVTISSGGLNGCFSD